MFDTTARHGGARRGRHIDAAPAFVFPPDKNSKINTVLFADNSNITIFVAKQSTSHMDTLVMKTSHTPDGFCCSCDLLPGWTVSGRRDFGQFDRFVRESVGFYVSCAKADGDPLPPQLDGEWTVSYQMDAAALLNYYKGILPLSGLARLTGINQRQLAHYAAGRSRPRAGQATKIEDALHRLGRELQGVKVLV